MPSHLKSAGGIIVPINSLQLIPNETYTLDGHDTHERESREAQGGEYKYIVVLKYQSFDTGLDFGSDFRSDFGPDFGLDFGPLVTICDYLVID